MQTQLDASRETDKTNVQSLRPVKGVVTYIALTGQDARAYWSAEKNSIQEYIDDGAKV